MSHPGYCTIQHNPELLKDKVKKIKKVLKSAKCKGVQGLVFTGKSGVFMAGALAMSGVKLPMVFIRKPGDNSHGNKIENNNSLDDLWWTTASLMFVDDLVDTGTTLKNSEEALDLNASTRKWFVDYVLTFAYPFVEKDESNVLIAGRIRKHYINI